MDEDEALMMLAAEINEINNEIFESQTLVNVMREKLGEFKPERADPTLEYRV